MKIAVFGTTGQVATELQRRAPASVTLQAIGRDAADFTAPDAVHDVARSLKVDAVINAVAYTAVDKAESDADLANTVNGASVRALAKACKASATPLVHISTDYVFDGSGKAPRSPDAPTGPLGVYGGSKLLGENGIRDVGGVHAILRTSWVFSAHGSNFVKTMLRLGAEREKLTIVADQVGGPTPADAIADTCLAIAAQLAADPGKSGTYHFSGMPDDSWAGFAREIFAQSGLKCVVEDIPTSTYPTAAKRPLNSRLGCVETETVFGIPRPDWRHSLTAALNELGALS